MKHYVSCVWQAVVLASVLSVPAWSTTLYTDGGIGDLLGGNYINEGYEISDSFTISSDSTVTTVSNVGLWVFNGDVPGTLDWSISTSPDGGGTLEGSGSGVSLSTGFFGDGGGTTYTVYSASFPVGSLDLSAGTYYLTLDDATTVGGGISGPGVAWDVTCGLPGCAPSTEYENGVLGTSPNSFEIDGTSAAPEPSTAFLLGVPLLIFELARRARRHRNAHRS